METKLIQITSGKGPEECERVVFRVFNLVKKQALSQNLSLELVDITPGKYSDTYLSVLFKLSGTSVTDFCAEWEGTIQWTGQSPFRKLHKRKNWFVGLVVHTIPKETQWNEKDLAFQTLRASGPGGQNVNKVESAVRATHLPSGISVTASDERSQLMNKKAAEMRLKNKLLSLQLEKTVTQNKGQWMEHNMLQRGNPVKVFKAGLG